MPARLRRSRPNVRVAPVLLLLLLGGLPAVVRADPILITDSRYVYTGLSLVPGTWMEQLRAPDVPFGTFDATLAASASAGEGTVRSTSAQRSTVSPTRFTGSGRTENVATAASGVVSSSAVSLFAATFTLTTPHVFHFSGEFLRSDTGFVEFEIAFAGEGGLGEGGLGTSGILGPGEHELYIWLLSEVHGFPGEGTAYASGSYDVDVSLHPVPEPASMTLLAVGLASLAAGRRLRTRSSRRR